MNRKYEDLDKKVSKEIMKEFQGKEVDVQCSSCWGEGHFGIDDDLYTRKCERCDGKGHYKVIF